MKKITFLLSFLIMFTACKGNEDKTKDDNAAQETKLKRYDVKSGIVEYKTTISGSVMGGTVTGSGTQSLYFKNWGALELRKENSTQTTSIKVFGKENKQTTKTNIIDKLDNGESYHVDMDKKQTYLSRDPMMDIMKQTGTDAGHAGKKMLESMGGKLVGNEKFMGYDCEIWEIMGGKQWIYKGVMLKLEMTMMGVKTVTEATTAKFDVSVADNYFKLPDYPVVKEEGYLNNNQLNDEMEDMNANMDKLSKMSYEEWKKMALTDKEDEEIQNMSEEELRQTYDMMQKMIKMRQGK